MRSNRGTTSLKRRRRNADAMREFDRLPAELRSWLATAILPWSPRSVSRAFHRAVAETQDRKAALDALTRMQRCAVARDAQSIWGPDPPFTQEAAR